MSVETCALCDGIGWMQVLERVSFREVSFSKRSGHDCSWHLERNVLLVHSPSKDSMSSNE